MLSCTTLFTTACMFRAGWTQSPGREMEQGSGELPGSRVVTLTGSRMEFVINNSEGGWCDHTLRAELQHHECSLQLSNLCCQGKQSSCLCGACKCVPRAP